jgi:hypothetical protein
MGNLFASHTPSKTLCAYETMPTLEEWKKLSFVGSLFSSLRRNDPCLTQIDHMVHSYERAVSSRASAGQKQYLLGSIFMATMYWNNHHKKDSRMEGARRSAIMSLNVTAANMLARAFHCQLGEVGAKIRLLFGNEMTTHGYKEDTGHAEYYLTAAKRAAFRTSLVSGRLYRPDFKSTDPAMPCLLLDTDGDEQKMAGVVGGDATRNGESGYALSMSNELYVGPLLGGRSEISRREAIHESAPVFHSTFMAGKPVQCAGMITVRKGLVIFISSASGHYMPNDVRLVQVLRMLQLGGMPLRQINVMNFVNNDKGQGDEFLRANGNWAALKKANVFRQA